MKKLPTTLTSQISDIIAVELQRRPVIHLHLQVPTHLANNPEELAATIVRALSEFQVVPDRSGSPVRI